jgi:hypothetical protein
MNGLANYSRGKSISMGSPHKHWTEIVSPARDFLPNVIQVSLTAQWQWCADNITSAVQSRFRVVKTIAIGDVKNTTDYKINSLLNV